MTSNDTNPADSDALERAFELVSRQVDGDLSAAESQELAALETSNAARIAEFRNGCRRLQSMLRAIPVQSVRRPLWTAPEVAVLKSDRSWAGRRKGVAWGSVAVVIAGCLVLAMTRPWNASSRSDHQPEVALNFSPMLAKSAPGLDAPERGMTEAEVFARTEADAFVMAEEDREPLSDNEHLIQPLLETANWKIVVVQLDEKDRDVAMQKIQSIVHEHGLSLRSATDTESSDFTSDDSDFVGVVLTSAVSRKDELVSAMEEQVADSRVDRNLSRSAESRRDEIIEAFRNSLQHPTRSELHHGKVYVALSTGRSNDRSSAGSLLADSADSAAATDATNRAAAGSANPLADPSIAAVTLVVFEFRSNADDQKGDPSAPANNKRPGQPL